MNENCKTSLQFIDGKPAPAFCMSESCFERSMYNDYGYTTMMPKSDVESITKQDLIDHPEKFKPFKHSICTGFHIKYKHLKDSIKYINGKWEWVSRMKCAANPRTKTITKDVIYMELHYPKYYKKLITKNGLPETYSQIKESGNKCNPPDLTVKKDSESTTDGECENVSPEASTRSVVSSNGKTHHAVPINITPEQVNVDELPEKITYVKRKVGDGFMFVVEDEQASKVTPGNNGKSVDAAEINYTYIPEPSDLKL